MDSDGWDERYAGSEYVWTAAANRFVEEHLAALAPGTAIDLAAGEGRNAAWLAVKGWRVTAVDFSAVGLDKARRLAADNTVTDMIEFVRADVTEWQPATTVDLVVLAYVQLPTEQRRRVLERAAGWLAPGGVVFVVAHDRTNIEHGYGGPQSEAVCYELDETVAAFAGLDVATAEVAERVVETPDGPRTALDTVVLARAPVTTS